MRQIEDLNQKEKRVLDYIKESVAAKGYPPAIREIGKLVGFSSSSTAHTYFNRLEQKGYIRRDQTKPRVIEILYQENDVHYSENEALVTIPILGQVAAGVPLLAVENHDDVITLPRELTGFGEVFLLKVRRDSMIEAGILENDLILVRTTAKCCKRRNSRRHDRW